MNVRKTLTAAAAALSLVLFSGCVPVYTPAIGILLTDVYGPIDSNGRVGKKEGRACAQSILMLVATGDASIKAAAANGGITKIDSIDHYSRNILGVIADFCTIVRGS